MGMKKEELDYVLVPLGLALMAGYHAWLLLRVRRQPATTVIGVNAINRRIWVRHIMEVGSISSPCHIISRALKLRIICMNACTHAQSHTIHPIFFSWHAFAPFFFHD
jgi:ribosomal protein L36